MLRIYGIKTDKETGEIIKDRSYGTKCIMQLHRLNITD